MKIILPVVLLLLPASYAGEYFELHRDAYEVVLNSNNFTPHEKRLFQIQYEILVLKDELLMELKTILQPHGSDAKVSTVGQLVDKISQKRHQMYLFLFDMQKKSNEGMFSPHCAGVLSEFELAEAIDFESCLSNMSYRNSAGLRKFYYDIMRHTTIYRLEGHQERDVFVQTLLKDSLMRNIKETNIKETEPCGSDD